MNPILSAPAGNRKHIVLIGAANAGKSSLMNALTGQDVSIVSPVSGTTTDVVTKPMELLPYGPVVWVDTGGVNDASPLRSERLARTQAALRTADIVVWVIDGERIGSALPRPPTTKAPMVRVVNKSDTLSTEFRNQLQSTYTDLLFISARTNEGVEALRDRLVDLLRTHTPEDEPLVGDLLPAGSRVLLVVPIDSETPKGRLILPQVQVLRDCLDHHQITTVVRPEELARELELVAPDLIVTDSQLFREVDAVVQGRFPLTGFSILFARQKGDLRLLVEGARTIWRLTAESRVLIAESCTHTTSHEDIARVKLPTLLRKRAGEGLTIDYAHGKSFPTDLTPYNLIIHCGGCMMTRREQGVRLESAVAQGVAITNFGVALAALSGILDRAVAPFDSLLQI